MNKWIVTLASAAALAVTLPAVAQQKAPEAKKIEIPKDTFYAGLGPTQYLIKARYIGAQVVDKSGARLGVVDDVILGTKDNKIDGFIFDAGGKKLGLRITATKIETKDGKTIVMAPGVTMEMVKSGLPAFGTKK